MNEAERHSRFLSENSDRLRVAMWIFSQTPIPIRLRMDRLDGLNVADYKVRGIFKAVVEALDLGDYVKQKAPGMSYVEFRDAAEVRNILQAALFGGKEPPKTEGPEPLTPMSAGDASNFDLSAWLGEWRALIAKRGNVPVEKVHVSISA